MLKKLLFRLLPRSLYIAYLNRLNHRYGAMDTQQVFEEVYQKKIWDQGDSKLEDYCSGTGTTSESTQKYIRFLTQFIKETGIISIVEIGCGDFRIMNRVIQESGLKYYHGVDIVPGLIERNKAEFGKSNVEFSCLNAVTNILPEGECLIIRQVLQHLNNQQIQSILAKTTAYRYVLVTEHVPVNCAQPNKDKIQGPETRLKSQSGVFIEKPPFNITTATTLLKYEENYAFMNGTIEATMRTSLIDNSNTANAASHTNKTGHLNVHEKN